MLEINFVTVLVYVPKILGPWCGPCPIHTQKFKDRCPDFGILFIEPGGPDGTTRTRKILKLKDEDRLRTK